MDPEMTKICDALDKKAERFAKVCEDVSGGDPWSLPFHREFRELVQRLRDRDAGIKDKKYEFPL